MNIKSIIGSGLGLMLLIVAMIGCKKLPVYQSYWNSPGFDVNQFSGFDYPTQLRWKVSNDSSNLYLIIDSYEKSTIHRILKDGLKIYFDTTATGKKYCYLACRGTESMPMNQNMNPSTTEDLTELPEQSQSNVRRVSGSFKEASWNDGTNEVTYDLLFDKTKLKCNYAFDSTGHFICNVSLPLGIINHPGFRGMKKLAIGIILENSGHERTGRHDGNASQMDPSEGSMRGGGGRHGGMGGGRMGGSHGVMHGGDRSVGGSGNMQDPVNIWFIAEFGNSGIGKGN